MLPKNLTHNARTPCPLLSLPLLPPHHFVSLSRLQSASATLTQSAATSLRGPGSPRGAPVGAFVTTAGTTLWGAGASAVAMVTTATHPCPSTPPTPAHVRPSSLS